MDCPVPNPVYQDEPGTPAYLFRPRILVDYPGTQATITVTVDGFEAHVLALTRSTTHRELEPVALEHRFYNTRTDEDRYNGVGAVQEHRVRTVLTDTQRREASVSCNFILTYP